MNRLLILMTTVFSLTLFGNEPLISMTQNMYEGSNHIYIETNYGDLVIELNDSASAAQVKKLVSLGIYNGVDFSSADKGYYIQVDDARNNRNTLSEAQLLALQPIDSLQTAKSHIRGTVSLTPNFETKKGESALTITLSDSPNLDPVQTIVGQVVKGDEVLSLMNRLPRDANLVFKEVVSIFSAVAMSKDLALAKFNLRGSQSKAQDLLKFFVFSFGLILLLAVLGFALYVNLSPRQLVALLMIAGLISAFCAMTILLNYIEEGSIISLVLFASMIAIYKFMNRFESQKP